MKVKENTRNSKPLHLTSGVANIVLLYDKKAIGSG